MRTMEIKDFLPGDILLFKVDVDDPNTEWISKAIALLTKSDVSHAALYMDNKIISDEGLDGLACHVISDENATRPIYVMRLDKPADKNPVLEAAENYINCHEPYDKSALLLLGTILLYGDFPIHMLPVNLVIHVLKIAASAINECINHHLYPDKQPMVCSQYVFQCYEDAGEPYKLILDNKVQKHQTFISLIYEAILTDKDENNLVLNENTYPEIHNDNLGLDFVKALQNIDLSKPIPPVSDSFIGTKELKQSVLDFSNKLYALINKQDSNLSPIEKLRVNSTINSKSLFVTPEDLKKCSNLTDEGDSIIYRDSEPASITR